MIYKGKETISEESEKSLMMGYNSKRHEFEVEYDNEAEELVAEMDFKDNDTKQERELKLRVLRIYAKRYLRTLISLSYNNKSHSL